MKGRTRGALVMTALLLLATPGFAQQELGFVGSAGIHGLGIGLDYEFLPWLAASMRAEGVTLVRHRAVLGAGAIVWPVQGRNAGLYAIGLYGAASCQRGLDYANCDSTDWRSAAFTGGGLELSLDDQNRWSAGVEAGWWFLLDDGTDGDDLDHGTIAALVRWRP